LDVLSLLWIVRLATTTLKRAGGALKVTLEELQSTVMTLMLNRQQAFLPHRAATIEGGLLAARLSAAEDIALVWAAWLLCDYDGGERNPHDQDHEWKGTREETDAAHVSDPPFPGRP
jgi:hypothetical protein